jgi:organic radical activating enzyme
MDDTNNKQLRHYDQTGKYVRTSVDEAIARGLNKWRSWKCSAGKRALYIDYDSNVWICNTASASVHRFNEDKFKELNDTSPESYKKFWKSEEAFKKKIEYSTESKLKYPGFLGNIETSFELPDDWVTCKWDSCGCGADVVLSKVKDDNYIPLLDVTHYGYYGRDITTNNLVDEINEQVAVELNFPMDYQILWDIGRYCNYECSYCWPGVHNKTSKHLDYDLILNAASRIIEEFADGASIRWNFGGGEPTLHPNFTEWMKCLKEKNQWTMVTTNGSHSAKFWKECVKYLNSILFSAHFEFIKEDRFIENIKIACSYHDEHNDDHWIEVKLMAPPESVERALQLKNRIINETSLLSLGANGRIKGAISLVPIRTLGDSGKITEYSETQLLMFRNQ